MHLIRGNFGRSGHKSNEKTRPTHTLKGEGKASGKRRKKKAEKRDSMKRRSFVTLGPTGCSVGGRRALEGKPQT